MFLYLTLYFYVVNLVTDQVKKYYQVLTSVRTIAKFTILNLYEK